MIALQKVAKIGVWFEMAFAAKSIFSNAKEALYGIKS
jgi:hypothetical protein